jgi:hypothetical protein
MHPLTGRKASLERPNELSGSGRRTLSGMVTPKPRGGASLGNPKAHQSNCRCRTGRLKRLSHMTKRIVGLGQTNPKRDGHPDAQGRCVIG